MSLHECAICKKSDFIYTLEIPGEEPEDPKTIKYVCGSCWDIIAQIAKLATAKEVSNG